MWYDPFEQTCSRRGPAEHVEAFGVRLALEPAHDETLQQLASVSRLLPQHGAPDKQEKATQTVLEQAEVLSEAWAAA